MPLASVKHLPKHIRSKCTSCELSKLKPKKASLTRRRRIREFQRIERGKIRRTSRKRNSKHRRERCTRPLRISVNSKKGLKLPQFVFHRNDMFMNALHMNVPYSTMPVLWDKGITNKYC